MRRHEAVKCSDVVGKYMSCDVAGHLPMGVGDEDELTRVAEARSRGSHMPCLHK